MVTDNQLRHLEWAIDFAEHDKGPRDGFHQEHDIMVRRARAALAQVRSDYRAARALRRSQPPAPRRELQCVALGDKKA